MPPPHTDDTSRLYLLLGTALLLTAWELAGRTHLAGHTLPALTEVLAVYTQPVRLALLTRSAAATLASAGQGLLLGTALGVLTAVTAHLLPPVRPGLDRIASIVQAVPAIALGPLLIITLGREQTPVALATLPVFFLIYIAATSGLRSASSRLGLMLRALGASPWQRLRYIEAPSALPSLVSGLKLSVATALIGAIVGEWFGASTGLGIVILNTMQNFQIPLMWAAVLTVTALSLTAYGLLTLFERAVTRRFA